jgi:hypothetical protein
MSVSLTSVHFLFHGGTVLRSCAFWGRSYDLGLLVLHHTKNSAADGFRMGPDRHAGSGVIGGASTS